MKTFKSILQFAKTFDTDEKCRLYLEEQRWGGTPACVHCGSTNVCRFANNSGLFKCREKQCRKKFSVTVGTVYQDRKLPLSKIFLAVYVLSVHSKGISSLQLANLLDISQKAAWLLNHKVRAMLTDGERELLKGTVEADETYVGGKAGNKHGHAYKSREQRNERKDATALGEKYVGRSPFSDKTMVAGMVERGGKIITKVIPDTRGETLKLFVSANVVAGANLYTDEWKGYRKLAKFYNHKTVQHNINEYVSSERDGGRKVHTNTIEGFWSLLKRQIIGIHHSVSPKHLQRYSDEAAYRYNSRALTQDVRFANVLKRVDGSLTYEELIAEQF